MRPEVPNRVLVQRVQNQGLLEHRAALFNLTEGDESLAQVIENYRARRICSVEISSFETKYVQYAVFSVRWARSCASKQGATQSVQDESSFMEKESR